MPWLVSSCTYAKTMSVTLTGHIQLWTSTASTRMQNRHSHRRLWHWVSPVVQEADPEGRQRTDGSPWAAVSTAHLHVSLQAHLREYGGQMCLPVLERWQLACRQDDSRIFIM